MPDLAGKTILVTGATDGIGRIAAERLARSGATLLLHGRDPDRVARAVDEIGGAAGHERVQGFVADYSSLQQVRQLAQEVAKSHPRLDVLINNAGIGTLTDGSHERMISEDGYELRFQVNYLAHFLLTHLLLPQLRQASPARIVNVASAGQVDIDFDDVMLADGYEGMRAYRQSKLALIMFTISLAQRLDAEDVTVNALHPGSLLDTKMVRETFGRPWGKAEDGAENEIHLATSPELESISGCYFDRKTETRALAQAYDDAARQRLWSLSEDLVEM